MRSFKSWIYFAFESRLLKVVRVIKGSHRHHTVPLIEMRLYSHQEEGVRVDLHYLTLSDHVVYRYQSREGAL